MSELQHAPLGELLIQHGGMSEEHLQAALAEQQATGRPLGEIVVERGYVPAAMVAQALATQQGGLTKTEYGYATGWAEAIDERDRTIAELRRWAERAQAAIASRDAEIERLGGELAAAGGAEELRAEITRLGGDGDELRARVTSLQSELETGNGALASRDAEIERLGGELAAANARVPALERDLAAARQELERESARLATLAAEAAEAEQLLEGLRAQAAAATARAEEAERVVEARRDPWAQAESHLLFVRRPDGYELVERDGPPPAAGEPVEAGTVQRVAALGGKPCAYVID